MDELNLYDDLDEFQEQQEKKSKELQYVEEKYQQSLKTIEELREENKKLTKNIQRIEIGFQSLLDTARMEIKRKDKEIERLRKEKDDICFRRKISQTTSNISENQQLLHDTANNSSKSDNIKSNNKEIPAIDPSNVKRNTKVKKRHRGRDDRDERSHTSDYKRHRSARDEYEDKYDQKTNKHTKIRHNSDDSPKSSKDLYRDTYKDSNYRRDYSRNRSGERKYYDKTSSSNVHSQSSKASESPESHGRHVERSRSRDGDKYKNFERNRSHDRKNSDKYSKLSSRSPTRKNKDPKADDYQHEKSYKKKETDKCHKQIVKDLGKQKSNIFKGREESKNPSSVQEVKHNRTDNLLDEKTNIQLPVDNTINAKNLKEHNELERTEITQTTDNLKIVAIDKELSQDQKVQSEKELKPSTFYTPRLLALFTKLFGESPTKSSSDSSCKSSNSLAKSSSAEVISSSSTSPDEYTDISSGKQTPKENSIELIRSGSNSPVFNKDVNDEPSTPKRANRKHSVDIDIDNCFILSSNISKNVKTIDCVDLTEIVDDQIESELELIEIPGLDLCSQRINATNISTKTQDKSILKCDATTKNNDFKINHELKSLDENITEDLNERHELSLETDNKKETANNVNTETEEETANVAENTTEGDSCSFNKTLKNACTSLSLQLYPSKQQHVVKETAADNADNKKALSPKHVQLEKKHTDIADNVTSQVVNVDSIKSGSILSLQNSYNTEKDKNTLKYECSAEVKENVIETLTQHVQENPTTKSSTLENLLTSVETQMQIMHTNRIPYVKQLSLLEDKNGNKNRAAKAAKDELHVNSKHELNDSKLIDESNIEAVTQTFLTSETPSVREEDQHSLNLKSAENKTFATENIPAAKSNIKENSADIIVESDDQPESTSVAKLSCPETCKVLTSAEQREAVSSTTDCNTEILEENLATTSNIKEHFNEIENVENIKQSKTVTVLKASKVVQSDSQNLSSLIESTAFSFLSQNVAAASVGTKGIDKETSSNKIRDSDLIENSNNNKPSSSVTKIQVETKSLETKTFIDNDLDDIKIVKNGKESEATATDDLSNQNILEAIQSEGKNCSLIEEKDGQSLNLLTDNPTSFSTGNPFEGNAKDSTAVESNESDKETFSIQENQLHSTELALEAITKDATAVEIYESDLTEQSMYIKKNSFENNENDQETSLKSTAKDIYQDSSNEHTNLVTNNSTVSQEDGSKMATTTNDCIREINIQEPTSKKVTHSQPEAETSSIILTNDSNKVILESSDTLTNISDLEANEKTSSIQKNHTKITPVKETCLETHQLETNKDETTAKIVSLEVKEVTSNYGNDVTESQEETMKQIELHIAQTSTTDPANEGLTFKSKESNEGNEEETPAISDSNNMNETKTNSFDLETQLITSTNNTKKETSNGELCDSVIAEAEIITAQDSESLTPKACNFAKYIENLKVPTVKISDLVSKANADSKNNEATIPIPSILEACLKTLRIELKTEEKINEALKPLLDMTKKYENLADKSDGKDLNEKTLTTVANEEAIPHKDNAIETVSNGTESIANKVLELSISEEPQQMEFQEVSLLNITQDSQLFSGKDAHEISHQLSESKGLQYSQARYQTAHENDNPGMLKKDNDKISAENSLEVKTKLIDEISTKTYTQKPNTAEEAVAEVSNLKADRATKSSQKVKTNLTDHNSSKIYTVTATKATQNLPKENQVDVVLKPRQTNFSETLKKHLKEYFTNKAENYYKSNINKNISLKETAKAFENKNKHEFGMFPKSIEKLVLETDWSQTTKCLKKPISQFNYQLSAPNTSKVVIEKAANKQALKFFEDKNNASKQTETVAQNIESTNKEKQELNLQKLQEKFKKCHTTLTAIVKTSAVIASPKNDTTSSLKNKEEPNKSNEVTGQLINYLKEAPVSQIIEKQNIIKDFQAKQTDNIAAQIPERNKALETSTNKGKPVEEAPKLNDNVINTTQEILNMKNFNKNQTTTSFKTKKEISVKSTEMKVQLPSNHKEPLANPVAICLNKETLAALKQQYIIKDNTRTSIKMNKDIDENKQENLYSKPALPVNSNITAVTNNISNRVQKTLGDIKNAITSYESQADNDNIASTSAQSLYASVAHQVGVEENKQSSHEAAKQKEVQIIEDVVVTNSKYFSKVNFEILKSDSKFLNKNSICPVEQILPCKSGVENTQIIDNQRNQIHKDSKITVLPAVKTKDSFINVSNYPTETLNICTPFKKVITKEINMEGEIVEVVKIQMLKDSNANNSNITQNIMENLKKQQPKTTKISTEVEGSSSKHQQAFKIFTKSNNLSVPTNEYRTEQNTPEISIKELAPEKIIEKFLLQECQKKETEGFSLQAFTKLLYSPDELKLIHKIVQERDNLHKISSNLTETFITHPALPSISTTSPTPSNFSGIFSKKSSSLVSTEDDFTKSKKKSPHFIAKLKEYILPAASVLCNVDNLENATKTNKKLHWELLDNKNEMTEIEDDADIDTTDEEGAKVKEEPLENASSPQNKTSSHKLQKSSTSETDTQTADESLLNNLKRKAGIYKKINFKHSKVQKPKQRKHKLPKAVKDRLKSIGILKADTFINEELIIQQPFSILMPKRQVGRPRKLDNCVTIKKVENTLPKKKRGRKPKQIIYEIPKESFQDIQEAKTRELIEKNKKRTAANCQQKQEEINKTITADFKTDLESLHSRERNIPHTNNMENSMKFLSTSVERLEICDESCSSNDSVKQKKSFEKEKENCKYEVGINTSMIYHKHDSSTKDINTLIRENLKQLEIKDKTEIFSVKNIFLENNITSPNTESLKKHQDVSLGSKETQKKRESTDKTDRGSLKNSHIEPSTVVSITKHHEVTSSNRETQERRFRKKSSSDSERVFSDDLCENTRKEKLLKSKTLTKPLMKNTLQTKIKNKVANFISLEDIGIKVRPLKGHLSSYRIPKIKRDTEETINNSWKLETYVELEKESDKEQVKQTAEYSKESNAVETLLNKNDWQKDKHQSPQQNVSKKQLTKIVKENSQQVTNSNIFKPLEKESIVEAVQEQLNKQQSKDTTASTTAYIINFDNKTKTGRRKLFSPNMYDEQDKQDPEETTENSSFETYQKQCIYLSKTHELNPVKLRQKSVHIPKKISDSSLNTHSDSGEIKSSIKCIKPHRKTMNVHRRILDSSCDEDNDTDKQSANEINKKQTLSKTVADLQRRLQTPASEKQANSANEKEVKKPLRGRRKSTYAERSALSAVESEESVTNTSSKALHRKSMYKESRSASETIESEEKETNLRRKAASTQSIYVESPASDTVESESMYVENTQLDMMEVSKTNYPTKSKNIESISSVNYTAVAVSELKLQLKIQNTVDNSKLADNSNNDCVKEQLPKEAIQSFKMRRKSMYSDPKSLNISQAVFVKATDKSPKTLTSDRVQKCSNNMENQDFELQTNKDGKHNVEISRTLSETSIKAQQTTKPIASLKMRKKSMYMERNTLNNEEIAKNKTEEKLEKKSEVWSAQIHLGSESPIIVTQQKPIQPLRRKYTNQLSNSLNKLEDSSQQIDTDSDSQMLLSQQKPNKMRKTSNSETRKDSVSSQQMDSGSDLSVELTQQKSITMRRKSTNQLHYLESTSVNKEDAVESKKSKQDVNAGSQTSNALTRPTYLGTINDDKNSRTNKKTKMDSLESHKSKQEVDTNSEEKILTKSASFVVATQEKPIKMRKKSTIEVIDTPEANKSIQVLQKKPQDMISKTDDIKEHCPCCSSFVTNSQTLTKRRKFTNQPQTTETSSADKKQEPDEDKGKHSNLSGQSSRGKETDSDSSIVLTQHKSIKMRRKSTNQRRILDSCSDDNEPIMKILNVITNKHTIPLTAAVKPKQGKRRSVKVLSTSLESPANTSNISQSSSGQPSPFTSPTLNHPIFNTEVPTQTNEFAASTPMTPNQQDDNKFKEIDSKLHEIFKSPQHTVVYKISPAVNASNIEILPPPPLNESNLNVTIDETFDSNQSSINMSQLNLSTSTLNNTSDTQNVSEIKHLSLGSADYRFEKVSDNVINLFISRKRKRKRNNSN